MILIYHNYKNKSIDINFKGVIILSLGYTLLSKRLQTLHRITTPILIIVVMCFHFLQG